MKSKRKLGLAFIILTMIIGVLIPNIDDKILAAGEIDYSSQVVVSDWDILDSSGVAISETNPASPENYYQLSGDWTLTINGATLKDGDYFKIALPKNEVSGSWSAVSSAWVDILADDNSTVLGQWRINSSNVEVQFNSNATGVYTVSGSFLTGSTSLKNSTFLGITQKVIFGGLEKTIAFTQAGSSLLSGNPGIVANHTSNNTIQWRIIMPSKSMNELTQNGKWGEEYTTDNQFLESKIEGEFNQLRISGIILNPNDLTNNDGRATAYSPFSVNVTSYFSEVAQDPLDTYDQFKAKIAPLNYGVYEDEYGERTVMINLGEVGNNGIRYSDIDNSFATKAANTLISNGYYDSSQQTVLEDYFTTTYGNGNVIGGNVATYRIFITETFPKVMSDSARLNSIIVSTNGTEKNLSATGTLQGLSGSGLSASAGTGRVYLSDVDSNAILEGISFKLQIKQGDGSWLDYGGWSTGITNDEGYVETSTLGLGTYRFVQLDKLSNDYDLSSSNSATGGYDTALGACVSEEFVIDSGGTGKVVTMTNMKYKYTVTYKPGTQGDFADNVHGNIVINSSTPSFSGSKDSLTGNPLGKTGYTFNGWDKNIAIAVTENSEYVATWKANSYSINYYLDDGINHASNPTTYTYGTGVSSFNNPSKDTYRFDGWYDDSDFTTANQITSIATTQTGTVNLYAKWVKQYTVTYDDNSATSGSVPTDIAKYESGQTIIAKGNTGDLKKTGHTFKGWTIKSDGSGTVYEENNLIPVSDSNITLYAKWEANKYDISYDLDGGTNDSGNPDKYTYGTGVTSFNKPTKTGHTFKGWYNEATFASEVTNISTVQTGAVKLYAKWEPNKYAISYNLNGGTNDSSNPKEYMYGIGVLSFNNPTKAGYTFKGWYDTASFDNKITNIPTTQLGTISLYAKWEVNEYAINYHLAGGVNDSNNPSTYTYGIGVTKLFEPTREGYTFKGWYTLPILGVEVKGISTTTLGTIDLYARWTPNTYAITYELDGGMNNSDNPNMYTYGVGVPTLKGATKEGYNFKGWYTAARTSNEVTNISDTQIGAITLYARWTPRTDVTYKVEHYQQQSDGTYLLVDINTLQGTTGEQVSAIAKVYQGYKLDNTVKGTLASGEVQADGSLVLKLYYNRNKSLSIITNPSTAPRPEGDGVGKPSMVNTADNTNIYNYVGLMMIALFWITISIKKRKENC